MAYPTTSDLKSWLGISGTSEDTQLGIIIAGAIESCEQATNRLWVAASATKVFPVAYPYVDDSRRVLTLFEDLCSVTSITNGDSVVISATEYDLKPLVAPYYRVVIRPESAKVFARSSVGAGVSIAGTWGATSDVPDDLKELILELAAHRYRMKQSANSGAVVATNKAGIVAQPGETPEYIKRGFELRRRRSR